MRKLFQAILSSLMVIGILPIALSSVVEADVLTTPSAPFSLKAAATGDRDITLTWQAPADDGGNAITNYEVSYVDNDGLGFSSGGWIALSPADGNATSYVFSGLRTDNHGTNYTFSVRAVNATGVGAESSVSCKSITAPAAEPSWIVMDRQIWVLLDTYNYGDGGSPINHIAVVATPTSGNGASIVVESDTQPVYVTGLINGIEYRFDCTYSNAVGTNFVSFTATPKASAIALPSAPQNLTATQTGDGEVTLTWSAPADDGGSTITNYEVSYADVGGQGYNSGGWLALDPADGNATSYTFSGLLWLRDTQGYTFSVRAVNAAGAGEAASITANAFVKPPIPEITYQIGNGRITIWVDTTASGDGGSPITRYYVSAIPADNSGSPTLSQTFLPIVLSGMTNGMEHTIVLRISNAFGTTDIPPFTVIPNASLPSVPSVPLNLTATQTGNSEVTFTWSAPESDGGSAITNYEVLCCANDGSTPCSNWIALDPANGNATSYVFKNLPADTNGTEYSFYVRALNIAGAGDHVWTICTVVNNPHTPTAGTISTAAVLPSAQVDADYSQTLAFSGSPAPTWSVSAGALPAGLTLDTQTGTIAGTPTQRGDYSFTVSADNGATPVATKSFTLSVLSPLDPVYPVDPALMEWTGTGTASFHILSDYAKFMDLINAQDGSLIPQSAYTTAPGSTIVTFTAQYLNSLPNGKYKYIARFTDGDSYPFELDVLVAANTNTANPGGNQNSTGGSGNNNQGVLPRTGTLERDAFDTVIILTILFGGLICLVGGIQFHRLDRKRS